MSTAASLAPLLERFFMQRLMQQRQASPHTISSYRDTFRQFLKFVQQRLHKPPSRLNFEEIDAPLVVAFLDDLEKRQEVSVRSRNLRLTAIHSFFRYAAFEAPAHSAQIQRVLAIPSKRFTRTLVPFLTRQEVDALLAAPDKNTWSGRREDVYKRQAFEPYIDHIRNFLFMLAIILDERRQRRILESREHELEYQIEIRNADLTRERDTACLLYTSRCV